MTTPHLKPLLTERAFWAAVIVGLPGVAYAYWESARAILYHTPFEVTVTAVALAANPITLYLAARQYPRGKAVEGVGVYEDTDDETGGE